MITQKYFRLPRLLNALTLVGLSLLVASLLTACQPAASTPETITVVETVVVTEMVEGEAVEVIITTTPAPAAEPIQATQPPPSTSGPTPTPKVVIIEVTPTAFDIEDRRIEVEWPTSMQATDSATVRMSFVPVEGGFAIVTEFPDDQLQVTQVAVKQLAAYELSAIANLDGIGFDVSPSGAQPKLVTPGEPLTWHWTISPTKTGQQRLSLSLTLSLTPLGEEQARPAGLYSKSLNVQSASATYPGSGLGWLGMV